MTAIYRYNHNKCLLITIYIIIKNYILTKKYKRERAYILS